MYEVGDLECRFYIQDPQLQNPLSLQAYLHSFPTTDHVFCLSTLSIPPSFQAYLPIFPLQPYLQNYLSKPHPYLPSGISPLVFTIEPETRDVNAGATAEFTCQATGNPDPSVNWYYQGKIIPFNDSKLINWLID